MIMQPYWQAAPCNTLKHDTHTRRVVFLLAQQEVCVKRAGGKMCVLGARRTSVLGGVGRECVWWVCVVGVRVCGQGGFKNVCVG